MQTDDLAIALGVGSNGDHRGNANDTAALAYLRVDGITPEIGPVTCERALLEEGTDTFVNILAQLGRGVFGCACDANSLHQISDAPGTDAGDPCRLDDREQRLFDNLAWLEEAG